MVYVTYFKLGLDGNLREDVGDRSIVILDGRNSLATMKQDAVRFNGYRRPVYKAYQICRGRSLCDSKPITPIIELKGN